MPGPYVVPVHGDADLPTQVDVVVIGGGIIGTSTALELAERGLRVALCEKRWYRARAIEPELGLVRFPGAIHVKCR